MRVVTYEEALPRGELPEGEGDVEEHDEVGDGDRLHVARGLAHQLVLDRALRVEGDVHVLRVRRVLFPLFEEVDQLQLPFLEYQLIILLPNDV